MKAAGCHVPNGLGARNDSGLIVCGRCGQGMTEEEYRAYRDKHPNPEPAGPVLR